MKLTDEKIIYELAHGAFVRRKAWRNGMLLYDDCDGHGLTMRVTGRALDSDEILQVNANATISVRDLQADDWEVGKYVAGGNSGAE